MPITSARGATNYVAPLFLDHFFNFVSWSKPNPYLALWSGSPTASGAGGSEVTTAGTNGYARKVVSAYDNAAASRHSKFNHMSFGPATADWSTVTHWALMTAATGGSMICYGETANSTMPNGWVYHFRTSNLSIGFTAATPALDQWCENTIEHVVGTTSYTRPSTLLALFDGDPLAAGVEAMVNSTNGYARIDLDAALGSASGNVITNPSAITFGPCTGVDWGNVDHFAIYYGTTKYLGVPAAFARYVAVGDSLVIPAGRLVIELAQGL